MGGALKAVQKNGGAPAAVTLDVYAELADNDLDAVGEALSKAGNPGNVGEMWANDGQSAEFAPTQIRK